MRRVVTLTVAPPLRPAISRIATRRPRARPFQTSAAQALALPAPAVVPIPNLDVSLAAAVLPALPEDSPLPPPPLRTDNLSSVAPAPALARVGSLQAAGFSTATSDNAPRASVQTASAGFGDVTLAAPAPSQRSIRTEPPRDVTRPVEILSKPRPVYTDEARRLRLEGEVLLEVLFSASGGAHVIRLLRGLGHGLDESAAAAATAIRYRPAEKAGAPADAAAVVRIVFQLAY